jgi:hypothetical protein
MLKVLMVALISSFGFALALSSSNQGLVFALAGTNAILKLEVLNAPNVLFNRKGITTFKLSHPFGKPLTQGLPNGTPDKTEPDVYYSSLKPLEFKIPIPKKTKPGVYPVKLEIDFYLCDTNIRVCYKESSSAKAELHIGQVGKYVPIFMKLERGGLQVR